MEYARYGVRIRNSSSMVIDPLASLYVQYTFMYVYRLSFYSNLPFSIIKRVNISMDLR